MLSYKEQRQYLKDQAYIMAEKEVLDDMEWGEWQEEMKQKPAKITVVMEKEEKVKEHDRVKTHH